MKKILIIAKYIAPENAVGAIRWTKIAKYLKKNHDVQIDVLTIEKNFGERKSYLPIVKKDPMLEHDMKCFDKCYIAPIKWYLKLFYALKAKAMTNKKVVNLSKNEYSSTKTGGIKRSYLHEFRDNYINYGEYTSVKSMIRKLDRDYDVIVSSYGPIWTHKIARICINRFHNTFWVADFRDPYVKDVLPDKLKIKYIKNIRTICKKANLVTKVNNGVTTYLDDSIKEVILSNGFDEAEKTPSIKSDKFIFAYTGMLYRGRQDLRPICNAIKELVDEGKVNKEHIRIEYCGPDGEIARNVMAECGVEELFINRGSVSRDEALTIQSKASCLIQLSWRTENENPMWSGKTYEYMMTEKPIIYGIKSNLTESLAYKNIKKIGGVCYESANHNITFSEMKSYIEEKYNQWSCEGKCTIDADKEYISQFSYLEISNRFWDYIN